MHVMTRYKIDNGAKYLTLHLRILYELVLLCLMLVTKYILDAIITDSSPDEVMSGHYSPYNVVYIVSVHSFESFCRKAHSNDVWIDICGHHWVKDTYIEENPIYSAFGKFSDTFPFSNFFYVTALL